MLFRAVPLAPMRNTLRFPRWSRFRLWPVGKSSQAIGLFLLVSSGLVTCEASGPPYRHESPGTAAPIVGAYRFQPPLQFYARNQRGEVFFEPGRGREPRTYFYLRMLGMDNQGALRVRQYEGLAQITAQGQRLELRSERCYIFGKRLWIDRMSPLARWDCSHLVFDYEWPPAPDGSLRPIFPSGPHELQRDWFSPVALVPMPVSEFTHNPEAVNPTAPAHQTPPDASTYGTGVHFAGQIILLTPENRDQSARTGFERTDKRAESGVNASPDPADLRGMSAEERERFHREQAERVADMRELQQADAIVWGFEGAELLRNGQLLNVQDEQGRHIGQLKVELRPGDFIICRWTGTPATFQNDRTLVAYTAESWLNRGGGLLD